METNFFHQLAVLNVTGNIRLNIQPQDDGKMTVSLLLINESFKDKTANNIPPLILKGSIEELDLKFFESITTPVQKNNQLLCNMKEHELALNNTQTTSNSKANAGSANKDKDNKRKRFDEQMKKVMDLEKLNKIGEAIGQMPDTKAYPEFETEIKTKMQQLRGKHGSLSLFGEPVVEQLAVPESDTNEKEGLDEPDENNDDDINENDGSNHDNDDDDNNEEENDPNR